LAQTKPDAAKLITPLQVLQWKRDRNPGKYASHVLRGTVVRTEAFVG